MTDSVAQHGHALPGTPEKLVQAWHLQTMSLVPQSMQCFSHRSHTLVRPHELQITHRWIPRADKTLTNIEDPLSDKGEGTLPDLSFVFQLRIRD